MNMPHGSLAHSSLKHCMRNPERNLKRHRNLINGIEDRDSHTAPDHKPLNSLCLGVPMVTVSISLLLCWLSVCLGRPCDIYAAAGTPCAAAHSVVRTLYTGYSGALYQLQRFTDNATLDIHANSSSGVADADVHDVFCATRGTLQNTLPDSTRSPTLAASADIAREATYPPRAACVISKIYDQVIIFPC